MKNTRRSSPPPARRFSVNFVFVGLMPLILLFAAGCSLYSSTGRKQFEEKAPTQIVQPQGFMLLGCKQLTVAEAWWKEEFPSTDTEIIATGPNQEIWSRTALNGEVEVTVFSRLENSFERSLEQPATESCRYHFSSVHAWEEQQERFLHEVSKSDGSAAPRGPNDAMLTF